MDSHDDLSGEFDEIGERLRNERPVATALELDAARTRVLARRPGTRANGGFMRPRLAMTAMLIVGTMLSGTGGALALSGTSEQGSAAQAVYPLAEEDSGGGPPPEEGPEVLGEDSGDPGDVQAGSQDAGAGERELPFTGLAAIPLIAAGLALMLGGVLLRRRAWPAG